MKKVLFVTSEVYPVMKTGGLADVSGSLPIALKALGHDVRLLMPAYADTLAKLPPLQAHHLPQAHSAIDILEGTLPGSEVPIWLVAHPGTFDRPGNPYLSPDGQSWADNAERFALLSRVAVEVAMNRVGFRWKPDVVHCHDWQTGLVPALLGDEPGRPATVFTIHNLAYQGLFPREALKRLGLPERFWSPQALEFYDQLSFIKGGLVYADRLSTVSPTYAREIQSKEFGCGLEGLLSQRRDRLHGILNGIDEQSWNPAHDPYIPYPFSAEDLSGKARVKSALQIQSGLEEDANIALIATVGRLVQQKGIDLIIEALPELMALPVQLVILGSGDRHYEHALRQWQRLYPERIALTLGYDERLAHLIEAGADLFLMPSRFEPCGLNQMYSQRYGTLPIVRSVGGLADTVDDINATNLSLGTASGICFKEATAETLLQAIQRALAVFNDKPLLEKIRRIAMRKDFSWQKSARQYEALYNLAEQDCRRQGGSMLLVQESYA